ncbi:hypothetical protein [Puerhibacterium sp. TATVAM-FAB25]|uniref:hypothetical protein n=1 Tax=Puerhibacterium sp. TATVAM-FAB25 TaxID=3093699 RepID=UPI00397D7DEC
MTSTRPPIPSRSSAPAGPLSWPLVLGLGSLALLWPLVELTGVAGVLGQPSASLLVVGLTAGAWVLGVGLGRVPRPVLTLTLAGGLYGALLLAVSSVLGLRPEVPAALLVVGAAGEILRSTALGAVAGLAAAAVQRARGPR